MVAHPEDGRVAEEDSPVAEEALVVEEAAEVGS